MIEFPKMAYYKRKPNRLYTIVDFKDGEALSFFSYPEKPSAKKKGYAFYTNGNDIRLINVAELEIAKPIY